MDETAQPKDTAPLVDLIQSFSDWLRNNGFSAEAADVAGWLAAGILIFLLAWLANVIAKRVLLTGVSFLVKRTSTNWDDYLERRKVFSRLSHLAPALVIYVTAGAFSGTVEVFLQRVSVVYMLLAGVLVINSFLSAVVDIYNTYEYARNRPIKGYIQVIKIVVAVFVGIVSIATLMDRSPVFFLSGIGAMTAIVILVFRDTILGLVASVQLTANDMVRIGDWVEMPKYGADGDVIDITLHTVMVRNWDKTITTIPAYALISDSFKNWRGMQESGGRRIKRSISIDMNSVKFCTPEMLDRFERINCLTEFIKTRRDEIARYNQERKIDTSIPVNGRNMTNIGTFRAYVTCYLRSHPMIKQDMTFLVRHLPPGPTGLPIEIYVFSADQVWANYEAIQADIFDHILAVVPEFELRVFQNPSGRDFQRLV